MTSQTDAEEYVLENTDTLLKIIRHSPNDFPRALALAALLEYGESPSISDIVSELEKFTDEKD